VQAHNFDEFRALLQGVAKIFPRKQLDDDTVQFYWRALRDMPVEILRQCVQNHERYGKRFPVPGELRPATDKTAIVRGDDPSFNAAVEANKSHWDRVVVEQGDMGRLLLADALLGRYCVDSEMDGAIREKVEILRSQVAQILRRADPLDVVGDPRTCGLVRQLFGEAGVRRLEDRAKVAA